MTVDFNFMSITNSYNRFQRYFVVRMTICCCSISFNLNVIIASFYCCFRCISVFLQLRTIHCIFRCCIHSTISYVSNFLVACIYTSISNGRTISNCQTTIINSSIANFQGTISTKINIFIQCIFNMSTISITCLFNS